MPLPNRAGAQHPLDPQPSTDQQRHHGGVEASLHGGTEARHDGASNSGDVVKLGTRVPRELARALKIAAATRGRTEQDIVIEAVREWLARHPAD